MSIFTLNALAQSSYPELESFSFDTVRNYYKKSYGYNTRDTCSGELCISPGTEVTCHNYSYKNGPIDGTKLQVCNISSLKTGEDTRTLKKNQYNVVTGLIDKSGEFNFDLPQGEVFEFRKSMFKSKTIYEPASTTQAQVCTENCESKTGVITDLKEQVTPIVEAIEPKAAETKEATGELKKKMGDFIATRLNPPPGLQIAPSCSSFINVDGEFGAWGKAALKNMKEVCSDCFFGPKSIGVGSLCPKFNNLSEKEKEYFWVWVYTSITQAESTCRPGVEVAGTRDKKTGVRERAVGLMQLEKSWTRRKARGPECATQGKETVFDVNFQFRCSASIIRDTRYVQGKSLYGNNGRGDQYWHRLQTTNGKISNLIKKFPGCH